MKRFFALLAFLPFCTALAFASPASSLVSAQRAQALLGTEVWSQIIRIENNGSIARYPRTFHALVFEVAGVLWFYTDSEGSQYFSTHRGRLAEDKADFTPLLREIHPGFQKWATVEPAPRSETTNPGPLRNGCFVESLANLRRLLLTGHTVLHPKILCYFPTAPGWTLGHAVLTFETEAGVKVIDPTWPKAPEVFPLTLAQSAQTLGQALGGQIGKALWVPVSDFAAILIAHYADPKRTKETAMVRDQRSLPAPQTVSAG